MGLDVYVGSLARYAAGDWLTIVQQAARDAGIQVEMLRATSPTNGAVTDPDLIREAIAGWQRGLVGALGAQGGWADDADSPYWTDKPDWDGYGGLVLLAAYDEKPELRPRDRGGIFRRKSAPDNPRAYGDSRAVQDAARAPLRYPSLLRGVEWWLPLGSGPSVFTAPGLSGEPTRMGRIDQLLDELRMLASRLGITGDADLRDIRLAGPPHAESDVESAGRFGLAVFLELAEIAHDTSLPLLLDY